MGCPGVHEGSTRRAGVGKRQELHRESWAPSLQEVPPPPAPRGGGAVKGTVFPGARLLPPFRGGRAGLPSGAEGARGAGTAPAARWAAPPPRPPRPPGRRPRYFHRPWRSGLRRPPPRPPPRSSRSADRPFSGGGGEPRSGGGSESERGRKRGGGPGGGPEGGPGGGRPASLSCGHRLAKDAHTQIIPSLGRTSPLEDAPTQKCWPGDFGQGESPSRMPLGGFQRVSAPEPFPGHPPTPWISSRSSPPRIPHPGGCYPQRMVTP